MADPGSWESSPAEANPTSASAAVPEEITAEEIQAELQKILLSPAFRTANRHCRFLRFVVDKTLAGDGEGIKEYLLGLEVFDRPSDYDPRNDPIVRVEAGRLRTRLADYYSADGAVDPIQIDLPKGNYAPVFHRRERSPVSAEGVSLSPSESRLDQSAELKTGRQTTRSTRSWAALVLVALAAIAAGITYLQIHRRQAVQGTSVDTIVLIDFSNTTGEDVFNGTLQQALTLQLAKSPLLDILPPQKVRETLTQMGRPATTAMTRDVAREVCERARGKVVVEGSIDRLGTEYVVGLRALDCSSGRQIAGEQERAGRREKVLDALAKAASQIRGQLGESLASVQRTSIYAGTTTSLEALKFYSEGVDTQDEQNDAASVPFFKKAIELDPTFALAYAALGMAYRDLGEETLSNNNFTKAFELRSRTSELEDFRISAFYYSYVTGELQKANDIYKLWAERYPKDAATHANLAINYNALGEYQKAVTETLEALRFQPDLGVGYGNLIGYYTSLGQLDKARETYEQALARKLDGTAVRGNRYSVAFLENDPATMASLEGWAADKPGVADLFLSLQSDTEAFYGRLRNARAASDRAVESALRNEQKETAALRLINAALREAEFGNPSLARSEVMRAISIAPTRSVKTLAALALARSGEPVLARRLADELEKQSPLDTGLNGYWLPAIRAAIELDAKSPAGAIAVLEAASPYELGQPDPGIGAGGLLYPVYLRGQAYLALGKGSQAAGEFQKFIDHRGVVVNGALGALARLGIARGNALEAETNDGLGRDSASSDSVERAPQPPKGSATNHGEASRAGMAYENFFKLWDNADPDIPIHKQAKAEYAKLK